jgi:hypothetical protein
MPATARPEEARAGMRRQGGRERVGKAAGPVHLPAAAVSPLLSGTMESASPAEPRRQHDGGGAPSK